MSSSSNKNEEYAIFGDPSSWTEAQVHRWMVWVAKEFGFDSSIIENYDIDGKNLCKMNQNDFIEKFPYGDLLWHYLELLKKVSENPPFAEFTSNSNAFVSSEVSPNITGRTMSSSSDSAKSTVSSKKTWPLFDRTTSGNRTAHSGQIQLWQFLLEMLTDADCQDYISWVGDSGEFKLLDPQTVAKMWGERKNKPAMNYEKLSRALRYYYDSEIISKVPGKRFVYKFVCNLKELVGFDAAELDKLVRECAERRRNATESRNVDEYLHKSDDCDLKQRLTSSSVS